MARLWVLAASVLGWQSAIVACSGEYARPGAPNDACASCVEAPDDATFVEDVPGDAGALKEAAPAPAELDGSTDAPPRAPCSKSPHAKGFVERSLLGGTFWTYVPATYDPKAPLPLVVALHGAGDAAKNYLTYEWQANADARGLVILAPQGSVEVSTGSGWTKADRARILTAIDDARSCYAIAEKRTILQGFSAGADMALFVGLTYSNDFDGIAVASGGLARAETKIAGGVALLPASRKLPVTLWRGASDPVVSASEITETKDRLEASGHVVTVRSFKGGHKTSPADALAQYDELTAAP